MWSFVGSFGLWRKAGKWLTVTGGMLLYLHDLRAQGAPDKYLAHLVEQQEEQIRMVTLVALVPVVLLFIFVFFFIYRHKRESAIRERELELRYAQKEMEMRALRAQVNPHFIFNCLGSIQHYIHHHDNELAERYLVKFSRLIRQVLEVSEEAFISLQDDLAILQLYIELEKMRMGGDLEWGVVLGDQLEPDHVYVPPLLLQPLVENAIWHGLANRTGVQRKLAIRFEKNRQHLRCEVVDNGMKKAGQPNHGGKSFGLNLVKERILFHASAMGSPVELQELLSETGEYEGMRVILIIPYEEG